MEKGQHGERSELSASSRTILGILLFVSGACSLIDQTVWLRQFRLLFGASTLATGAVLAVFMGGLGLGARLLGRRYDRHPHPLRIYGVLEIGIGLSTAATPFMLAGAQSVYSAAGGIEALGRLPATFLDFVLTTLILGVPTFLMGATLPLAARAMVGDGDRQRRGIAVLYGFNTVGAVAGVLLAGFLMLEVFGNRFTLWMSALTSLMVGLSALLLASKYAAQHAEPKVKLEQESSTRLIILRGAAAVSGLALLLMELVWYRMLTPLLGGTTYTFTVILAVVLLGIGSGSFFQASRRTSSSASTFLWITALEAIALAIPFALGDRIAVLALRLQSFAAQDFLHSIFSWVVVAAIVVFFPAFFSGMQFPLLVSLAGRGRTGISSETGSLYGWNTVGSLAGALSGGFGILALLSAPNSWRFSVMLLLMLVTIVWILERSVARPFALSLVLILTSSLLFAPGPTAFWRQTPIGAGRAGVSALRGNELKNFVNHRRRITVWQQDGVESAVGMTDHDGIAFLINGKNDGHSRFDAGTQVMGGLIGAMIHPEPVTAFVLGLGTGSTAGWLAAVPSIRKVQVAELEPATERVAAACSAVNRAVSSNAKVRVVWGDGREVLTTSRERFDIIFSEPSNPFRAGIASLFTVEFYNSVRSHLNERGIFLQWLQAYEIDLETLQTIYATLLSVFPTVETWQTERGDLVLAASMGPPRYEWQQLERRAAMEPFRSALEYGWAARGADGFLSHYIAGPSAAEAIAGGGLRNTDDRTVIEFSFARAVGDFEQFDPMYVFRFSTEMGDDTPPLEKSQRERIAEARLSMWSSWGVLAPNYALGSDQLRQRALIHQHFLRGARMVFDAASEPELTGQPVDELITAQMLAESGSQKYEPIIQQYQSTHPIEGGLVRSRFDLLNGRIRESTSALAAAFRRYRSDPWPFPQTMERAFVLAFEVAGKANREELAEIEESLALPFAVRLFNERRMVTRLSMAVKLDGERCGARTMAALEEFEPHIPWQRPLLELRARCLSGRPEGARAVRDLREFDSMVK